MKLKKKIIKECIKKEIKNPNLIGEILRSYSFKEEFGCYSCFDLIDKFKEISAMNHFKTCKKLLTDFEVSDLTKDEIFVKINKEEIDKIKMFYNEKDDILVAWIWDGDGILYFKHKKLKLLNTDCKKDYNWEFIK